MNDSVPNMNRKQRAMTLLFSLIGISMILPSRSAYADVEPRSDWCGGNHIPSGPGHLRVFFCGQKPPGGLAYSTLYRRITSETYAIDNVWVQVQLRNASGVVVATKSGPRTQWVAYEGSASVRAYCINASAYTTIIQCASEYL